LLTVAYHPIYAHPLPEGHRFPMAKYELIPAQLLYEGTLEPGHFFEPEPCTDEVILLTHDADYWHRMKHLELTYREMRKIGFPLSAQLVEREQRITKGTIDGALFALKHGCALNLAGGTHHAFANRGEGFCLLNDFAIAANYLLVSQLVNRVAVVDLDVHQGNGTAALFAGSQHVFTFSMHGGHNYPFHKETSSLDIPLHDGIEDKEYLDILEYYLSDIFESFEPDMVMYLSGVDVLQTDRYGKLKLTLEGCKTRDRMVFEACKQKDIPVTVSMGGGYSPDIKIIVEAHCNTYRVAADIFGT
jgi:acetoin utilization deacetylase AcuC-like enzyme